jgi:magnesium transporter
VTEERRPADARERLRATLFDADRPDEAVVPDIELVRRLADRQLLWIDVDARDPDRLGEVAALLELPRDALDYVGKDGGTARLTRRAGFLILTLQAIEAAGEDLNRREIDLVVGPNVLVSIHDGSVEAIARFRDQLGDEDRFGSLDAATFLAVLVDSVIGSWFARVEEIEREIDRLDEIALRGRDSEVFLVEVLRLRRRIALLRRIIAPHRVAFAPLARPDTDLDQGIGAMWPGLVERLERVMDAVENARELLVGSFDLYLGGAAHRSNEVMKALTVLSAVLLPSVVLAGVMGMNFHVAFFDDPSNFWRVLAVMIVFSIGLLVFARTRRWI